MNKLELENLICNCEKELKWLREIETSCKRCNHFGDDGICKKYGMKVPTEFISVGCDEWIFDDIPF